VNNSVTVINSSTFVTGRRETVNVRENLFLTEKINIGRPDIKPEKASYAPVVKTIEPARLPPQQVSRIQVKELKRERQLVKERSGSVINKGQPVKALAIRTVEQPKSPTEKVQERKQRGTSAAPGESPRVKAEARSASPSAAAETKETKGRGQSSREPAVKQRESAREKVQERQPQPEKGKSGAAVESPRVKAEEKAVSPSAGAETKGRKSPAPVAKTKPESTAEPRDRKSPRAEEKAATPLKPTEVIERKGASQLSVEQKGKKPLASPAKSSEAKAEIKSGQKTVAETKATKEEKKAKKEELDSKGKSAETQEEKLERKQKPLEQ
jgi:colicin import membrane protein